MVANAQVVSWLTRGCGCTEVPQTHERWTRQETVKMHVLGDSVTGALPEAAAVRVNAPQLNAARTVGLRSWLLLQSTSNPSAIHNPQGLLRIFEGGPIHPRV
jgi:hypothetical protein